MPFTDEGQEQKLSVKPDFMPQTELKKIKGREKSTWKSQITSINLAEVFICDAL